MALLSYRGISTPSLKAQGEQRRSSLFNIPRDNPSIRGFHGTKARVLRCALATTSLCDFLNKGSGASHSSRHYRGTTNFKRSESPKESRTGFLGIYAEIPGYLRSH